MTNCFSILVDGPSMPNSMMSRDRRIRMNYEYLKKCVNNSPVTPMCEEWWEAILDHVPDGLLNSSSMESHLQNLHEEGMSSIFNSPMKWLNPY